MCGEGDICVAAGLEVTHWATCPCVPEVGGVWDHFGGEDNGGVIFFGAASVVFAGDEVVCGCGVELSVVGSDGETLDWAAVVNGGDGAVELECDLVGRDFHFFDDWWGPCDLFFVAVLCGECPSCDAFAGGDFELGVVPSSVEVVD